MINFSIAKKLSILALILGSVLACKNAHDKVISDSGNNLATIEKIPNDLPTVWPNSAYLTSGAVTTLPNAAFSSLTPIA